MVKIRPRLVGTRSTKAGLARVAALNARRRAARKIAPAVKAYVKKAIHRESENKFVSLRQDLSFNSSISAAGECYPLMPAIPQGTDDFQRIGDKVSGRTLYIKGHIQYNTAYINNPRVDYYMPPSTVRILILSQKNIKSNLQIPSAPGVDVANLLKDNVATGSGRAYVGAMTDNLAPVNKDLFKVHFDRKVKMNSIYQSSDGTGTGGWVGLKTVYFTCKIKMPKTLCFDTTNGDNPNNFAPFFCLGSVLEDGSSPFSVGSPYRVTFLSTAYFEDS